MLAKGRPTKITKNSIASKCLELYWHKGIQNVTYNEAIKYSKCSKPTVYNLFKSEDELQAKTLEYYHNNYLVKLENIINKNEFPKGKENNKEDEKDQSSALGSIGLKPKIVH